MDHGNLVYMNVVSVSGNSPRRRLWNDTSMPVCKTKSMNSSRETSTITQCCDNCKKTFSNKSSLVRHVKAGTCNVPKTKILKTLLFECNDCKRKFTKKIRFVSHLRKCDGKSKENTRIACLKCNFKAPSKSELKKHYSENHGILFKVNNETFQSLGDFQKWLNDIEKKNTFRFRKARETKNRLHTVINYLCHRSGTYKDSCANKRRKRFLKKCGSKKIQGWCPAELIVRIRSSDGTCVIQYQETHIGHNVGDEKELCHVYLNKEEKLELATLIAEGLPIPHIKRICTSERDTRNNSRISTVSLKDLHNIASSHEVLFVGDQELTRELDCLCNRHHKAVEYLEKNDSINVCYVDEETFIIQSFEESAEDIPKTYTIMKNESKECIQADSACQLLCDLCGICFHEYRCSCIDSSIENNMCKHIHAIGISKPTSPEIESRNYVTTCEYMDFQDNVDYSTANVEDNGVDHDYIALQCEKTENTEAERIERVIEEIKEFFANVISYASSPEQLYEIKEKYLIPIKRTLLAAGKR